MTTTTTISNGEITPNPHTATTTHSNGTITTAQPEYKEPQPTPQPESTPLVDVVTPETPRPCAVRDGSGFIVYP